MMPLRHQLPVHSPLSLGGALRAAGSALRLGADPRPRLAAVLAREHAADAVVLCGSGTQALQLALTRALRTMGRSTSVALPGYSCFDVASAAVGANAAVTFYDLDPDTLAPDLPSLERALAQGARVVVVAPLYGMPVDWEALEACASRAGALLIEDAAQGHGAAWRGRPLGSLGRLGVLSFGRGKGWTAGKGGALLLRGEPLPDELASPSLGEPTRSAEAGLVAGVLGQWLLGRPALYGLPASLPSLGLGQTVYRDPVPPRQMRAAAAALLERTRTAAARAAAARCIRARGLLEHLPAGVTPVRPHPEAAPGYLRLPVRLPRGMASFPDPAAARRLGLAPGYPSTLSALPQLRTRIAGEIPRLLGAEELVHELITLPTHELLTPGERNQLLRLLDTCAGPAQGRPPAAAAAVGTRSAF